MSRAAATGRGVAAGLFVVVIALVPILELAHGVWPGVGAEDARTARTMLDGSWAEEVERELADRSEVARQVRPAYNASMFRLFREANPKVVVGEDDWLFLASTVRGAPPPGTPLAEGILDQVQELIEWFGSQGTEVYLLLVPNKASVYPEKLSAVRPRYTPVYDRLARQLLERGLWTDDFQALLSPGEGEPATYHAFDSHWTPATARKAVERVAQRIRERYTARGEALPGPEQPGELRTEAEQDFLGGTVAMLDVGDWWGLDRHFLERDRPIHGVDPRDGSELGTAPADGVDERSDRQSGNESGDDAGGDSPVAEPPALVWLGTSFSEGYRTASMLSALLQRPVEDRSLFGLGPTKAIVDLAREIRRGERVAPAVLVWEFPERYLFTSPAQMQETLRAALQSLDYDPETARPLDVAERRFERLRITRDQDGLLEGVADPDDPRLEFVLAQPLLADGSTAISFEITTSRFAAVRVWLDLGEGWPTRHQVQGLVPRKNTVQRMMVPLDGPGTLRAVRIDVVTERRQRASGPVELRLGPLEQWSR